MRISLPVLYDRFSPPQTQQGKDSQMRHLRLPKPISPRAPARLRLLASLLICSFALAGVAGAAPGAAAASMASSQKPLSVGRVPTPIAATGATSLESAATKAGETGRNVAMSLIGLALAIAAIVLAFKRDFREAAAVFAVGIVCVLLATPAGESLLRDTVNAIVGS
jgi:hypothetical protein